MSDHAREVLGKVGLSTGIGSPLLAMAENGPDLIHLLIALAGLVLAAAMNLDKLVNNTRLARDLWRSRGTRERRPPVR